VQIWVQEKDEPEIRKAFEQSLAVRELSPQAAADEAVRIGSVEPVNRLLTKAIQERLREQFGEVIATKTFKVDDIAAGRAHIKAYVEFIHFVERLYDSAMKAPHGHFEASRVPSKHH